MEPVTTTPVTLQERRRMHDSSSVCRSTVLVVDILLAGRWLKTRVWLSEEAWLAAPAFFARCLATLPSTRRTALWPLW